MVGDTMVETSAVATAALVAGTVEKQPVARQLWSTPSLIAVLKAFTAVAGTTAAIVVMVRWRRDRFAEPVGAKSRGAVVPQNPPAGPEEGLNAEHPKQGLDAEHPDPQALDEGLQALGMLSSPGSANDARVQQHRFVRESRAAANARPYLEEGVEDADDIVIVERVSPEEEERRYFANMAGGDLFDGIAQPDEPERRRAVINYETS